MKRRESATWNAKQERLALLLASGWSIKAAATEAGTGERTAHTWLSNSAFRAYVSELRGRIVFEATGQLTGLMTSAVRKLESVMNDPAAPAYVQLQAASKIMDSLIRMREHIELLERIEELERRADVKSTVSY
jgi:hypothetical protein